VVYEHVALEATPTPYNLNPLFPTINSNNMADPTLVSVTFGSRNDVWQYFIEKYSALRVVGVVT
jgi:hypothetical protein